MPWSSAASAPTSRRSPRSSATCAPRSSPATTDTRRLVSRRDGGGPHRHRPRRRHPADHALAGGATAQRRHRAVPRRRRRPRGAARAPRRAVLGQEGLRRLVDPQGRVRDGEDPLAAALREFEEEHGHGRPPRAGRRSATSGSRAASRSPPGPRGRPRRRGRAQQQLRDGVAAALGAPQEFPEIDRAEWFTLDEARGSSSPPRPSCSTGSLSG